jgi:hypothetical protein
VGRFERGIAIILALMGLMAVLGYKPRGNADRESKSQN